MAIASWQFCGCGYCVMLAVGQSVPEGGEMMQPCGAYPEGVRGVGYRFRYRFPLFRAS